MPRTPKYLAKTEAQASKLGRFLGRTFDRVTAERKANAWFARVFLGLEGGEKRVPPSRIVLFNMYYFEYRAKGWEEGSLPFYDRHPLSFIIDYNPTKGVGGTPLFLGLNLHYVPPRIRYNFIYDVLRVNESRLLRQKPPVIPYVWVKQRWPHLLTMVKSYIPKRMSKIYRVPIVDWEMSIYLKSPAFVGASPAEIARMAKEFSDKKKHLANPKQRRYDKRQSRKSAAPEWKGSTRGKNYK